MDNPILLKLGNGKFAIDADEYTKLTDEFAALDAKPMLSRDDGDRFTDVKRYLAEVEIDPDYLAALNAVGLPRVEVKKKRGRPKLHPELQIGPRPPIREVDEKRYDFKYSGPRVNIEEAFAEKDLDKLRDKVCELIEVCADLRKLTVYTFFDRTFERTGPLIRLYTNRRWKSIDRRILDVLERISGIRIARISDRFKGE